MLYKPAEEQNYPGTLSALDKSKLFIFLWSLEGNSVCSPSNTNKNHSKQKSACRLDKEGDAIWAPFKAHTFRLDSPVSGGSQRRIHLQAAVVKIEAAAQIARIPANRHGGDCSWNLLIYRIHSAESVCVCVVHAVQTRQLDRTQQRYVKSKNKAVRSTAWEMSLLKQKCSIFWNSSI